MGLTFATPLLLAGAALIAVPIVLHLVMRREPVHLMFPALRFLKQRVQTNRRQLRLRHLLLLLLRCAAIVLLAAALARPSIKAGGALGDREAPVAAALVFDTSSRMAYRHQNETRLDAARTTADWLLGQLPDESQVAVVDSTRAPAVFSVDLSAARQRIERLATTAASAQLIDRITAALELLVASDKERKEIYVFTDLARAAWPADAAARLAARLDEFSDVSLYLIDSGVDEPRNFSLADLQLSAQTLARNGSLRLSAELLRVGPEEQRAVRAYVRDKAGEPVLRDQKTFDWRAGESARAEFEIRVPEEGTHQGFVGIVGEDALPDDDRRYFSVEVRPAWRVLVAAPKPAEGYALFLTEALAPVTFRKTGQARFECEVVSLDELPERVLTNYAAVCLLDPTSLPATAWRQLNEYAAGGGGVAIWLGRNALPAEEFNSEEAALVLPAALRRVTEQETHLAPQDLQHPLLARFRPLEGSIPWDAFRVWTHWQLQNLDPAAAVVVAYQNGDPALVEKVVGRGRVLLMTTPVSDAASDPEVWNDLPTGPEPWPFVMLANEMLLYLSGSGDDRFNYFAGDEVVLRLSDPERFDTYSLVTPQDTVPQSADLQQNVFRVTSAQIPGNYRVRAGGSEGGVDRGFSVNIPAAATNLERTSKDELEAVLGEGRFRLARNRDEINRDVSIGRVGRELFAPLIVAVAVALGLEYYLANRFYRGDLKGERAPRPASQLAAETLAAAG